MDCPRCGHPRLLVRRTTRGVREDARRVECERCGTAALVASRITHVEDGRGALVKLADWLASVLPRLRAAPSEAPA